MATGLVYPRACVDHYTPAKLASHSSVPWALRQPTAFFRGGATGGGVTPETNQRMRLVQLSMESWAKDRHVSTLTLVATRPRCQGVSTTLIPHLEAVVVGICPQFC